MREVARWKNNDVDTERSAPRERSMSPQQKQLLGLLACAPFLLSGSTHESAQPEDVETSFLQDVVANIEPVDELDPHMITDKVVVLEDEPGIMQYESTFVAAAKEFDLNPNYLATIAWLETRGGEINEVSHAGAEGYMQILPETAQEALEETHLSEYDSSDDESSIWLAAGALHVMERYTDHVLSDAQLADIDHLEKQLISYNAGFGRTKLYADHGYDTSVLPQETQKYLQDARDILGN